MLLQRFNTARIDYLRAMAKTVRMIYILEDDDNIRKLIVYTLRSQNFSCEGFALPSEFWKKMEAEEPKLILLDIMLPEEDGFSILKKIRAEKRPVPVIMLTAKDTEFDVVAGLDAGADDYVTKPFGMMSLVSRIKAVLRRYEKSSEPKILKAASVTIDISKHTVFVGDRQVFLTVKEFDLLAILISNRGHVQSREQLLNSVWNINADIESRTVDVHIRTLRQKLGETENIIQTVRGVGYVINNE